MGSFVIGWSNGLSPMIQQEPQNNKVRSDPSAGGIAPIMRERHSF